jgi:ABC-type nickel/cobalt efflux system permease component RcnA
MVLLLHPFEAAARDNPFISKKTPKKEIRLPTVASKVFAKIVVWQEKLNTRLTEQVKRLKTDGSWEALWPLVVIAFFYGIVHAAGPGHGKFVVFSYFISRRSRVKKGLLLGNVIALLHAVSGVLIVLALYYVIKTAYLSSFEAMSQKIKLLSYGLVVVIGLVLFIQTVIRIRNHPIRAAEDTQTMISSNRSGVFPLAAAVGIVPCPGVVIIMLFALSFNLLAIGVMMSFLMALGMAVSISVAGLLSILGQESLLKGFSGKGKAQRLIQNGLKILGSLLMIGFGCVLLAGAL